MKTYENYDIKLQMIEPHPHSLLLIINSIFVLFLHGIENNE